MAYGRAISNKHIKIGGTWCVPGESFDVSSLGDEYVARLVDAGKIVLDNPAADVSSVVDHVSSDGSDHTFIDQDVTSGSAPVFDGTNFTNLPAGGATDIDGLSDAEKGSNLYLGGSFTSITSGSDNIAIAQSGNSGSAITTGSMNVTIGVGSFDQTLSRNRNVAIGSAALGQGLVGDDNIGIGYRAGGNLGTNESQVVCIGSSAGYGSDGYGVYIGFEAGKTGPGQQNVFVGRSAGSLATSASRYGTLIGGNVASSLTTGDANTIVGRYSDVDTGARADVVVLGQGITSGAEDGAIAIGSSNVAGNILRVESGVLTVGGDEYISVPDLQTLVAASTDFADYQTRIAAL